MKLYSIQYLRGLAALLVVIAHAGAHPLAAPTADQGRLGQFGVVLFFVISGFIMVAISGEGPIDGLVFLKRRIVRIVPLYWIFTTFAAVLALLAPQLFESTVLTLPHYALSMLFIPHEAPVRGGTSPLLALGWTLNYEMFFYLVFALLGWLRAGWRVVLLAVIFTALVAVGLALRPQNPVIAFYTSYDIVGFCLGAAIGLAFIKEKLSRVPMPLIVAVALGGLLAAFGFDRVADPTVVTYTGVLAVATALVAGGLRLESRLPRLRLLERLGDASYAVYLSHMFVVGGATALAARLLPHTLATYVVVVGIAVVIALAVGLAIHIWLERPLLALLRERRKIPGARPADVAAA